MRYSISFLSSLPKSDRDWQTLNSRRWRPSARVSSVSPIENWLHGRILPIVYCKSIGVHWNWKLPSFKCLFKGTVPSDIKAQGTSIVATALLSPWLGGDNDTTSVAISLLRIKEKKLIAFCDKILTLAVITFALLSATIRALNQIEGWSSATRTTMRRRRWRPQQLRTDGIVWFCCADKRPRLATLTPSLRGRTTLFRRRHFFPCSPESKSTWSN